MEPRDYERARPLFQELAEVQLCVEAALTGANPGQLWVDDLDTPRTAFLRAVEGDSVAGDEASDQVRAALKARIPYHAELYVHPRHWEARLGQIWHNSFARKQPRRHYLFKELHLPDWRALIPPGLELVRMDEQFLARAHLENYDEVAVRVRHHWHSPGDFLERGFGFALLHGETIVTRCMADCVAGPRCEMGIGTDVRYRRRGLAALTVAAAVEYCLARGLAEIGWHCLETNTGSRRVAERVGFELERTYHVWSSGLPAENAADLAPGEWWQWAELYDEARQVSHEHDLDAAAAWAQAGDSRRALAILHDMQARGWHAEPARLQKTWLFANLHSDPAWQALLSRLG
jgi:RimJ/RimL family protein N-acetyltransferase